MSDNDITRENLERDGWHETSKKGLFFKVDGDAKIQVYYSLTYGTSTLILPDFAKVSLIVPDMAVLNSLAIAFELE